jgi:hypothetical protein
MGTAAGLAVLIARHRPALGSRFLTFGCAALTAVVLYSGYLCDAVSRRPIYLEDDEADRFEAEADRLETGFRRSQAFRAAVRSALQDMRAGRATFAQAVARLARTEQARDPRWAERWRVHYPDRGDQEILAASLVQHAATDAGQADWQFVRCLETEYRALFGRDLPFPSAYPVARGSWHHQPPPYDFEDRRSPTWPQPERR